MLDGNDPNFFQRYPNGATVYDRTGRQLHGVVTCNPETGEVVRWDKSRIVGAVLRMASKRPRADLESPGWISPPRLLARAADGCAQATSATAGMGFMVFTC
jgi:hypothetical protein